MGTLLMFGGLAIMPFALMLLSEADTTGALWFGRTGAALAFIVVGAGLQITQTAGIALANDVSSDDKRPRVVALLYAMLLVGLIIGSAMLGGLLEKFSPLRLIQVVQGAAVVVVVLNLMSLWKQEARGTRRGAREPDGFSRNWKRLMALPKMRRFLWTVGLGTAAFSMQDIVLEPFGGEILGLSVSQTTYLTAFLALGGLIGFAWASHVLGKGADPFKMASRGAMVGIPAFCAVIFSAPQASVPMFTAGVIFIGFGAGLFGHGTLTATMNSAPSGQAGLALGAWGAVQASTAGLGMALGGILRDLAAQFTSSANAYSIVYSLEIVLLILTVFIMKPLVKIKS
jgi:BCD family chlorophyll transporter-like MFS transporter